MIFSLLLSLSTLSRAAEPEPVPQEDAPVAEEEKTERNIAVLGAPLFSYDSNLGIGYGAYGQVVFGDPSGERPYRANLDAQLYWTTGGYRNHYVRADLPGMFGSPLRYTGEVRFVSWTQAPWYGAGNDAPRDREWSPEFTWYERRRIQLKNRLRVTVAPDWEIMLAHRWANEQVQVLPDTLLAEDMPLGVEGGDYAWAALGVIYDARDSEIDPKEGVALSLSGRMAHPWLGSDWSNYGGNAEVRLYKAMDRRLVSATYLMADATWGDQPFFEQSSVGGLGRGIIGGRWILRGLPEERFHGDGLLLAQQELRWFFWEPMVGKAQLRLMLVPFVDVARVLDWDEEDDPWTHLHYTGGAGFRINLKDLLVFRVDVGVGWEEYTDGDGVIVQTYVLAEHPF